MTKSGEIIAKFMKNHNGIQRNFCKIQENRNGNLERKMKITYGKTYQNYPNKMGVKYIDKNKFSIYPVNRISIFEIHFNIFFFLFCNFQ